MKKCKRCELAKPLTKFRKTYVRDKYYYRPYCTKCLNKFTNERRAKNPVLKRKKNAQQRAAYHKSHPKQS